MMVEFTYFTRGIFIDLINSFQDGVDWNCMVGVEILSEYAGEKES